MYQLEERILFDGAAAVDLAVAQQEQQAQEAQAQTDAQPQPDTAAPGAQPQTVAPDKTAPALLPADTHSSVHTTNIAAADTTAASLSAPIDASNPSQPADTRHVNVLVVSDSLENADQLFKSANSDTILVRYNDKTTTGAELLQEITDALHGEKADSIGFVTDKAHHGSVKIFADSDTSEKTLSTETQQKFWNGVEGLLSDNGKVNIFASDLASTANGRHLVDSLSQITNHQVAASTDVTGDKDAGGDWELEYVAKGSGSVDLIEEYFNRESIQSFEHRIEKPTEIAFIDSSVRDIDTILKGIGEQAEIVYLNKDHAFEQITSYLQGRADVDAVHLISDGTSGEFYLGNKTVNSDFIAAHHDELAAWGKAMAADGDIHIYGCELAKDQVGKDIVNQISTLTGADVAASTDRTGIAGNWNLEFTAGEIQTAGFVIGDYLHNLKTLTVIRLVDAKVDNPISINEKNLTLREALLIAVDGDNIVFADPPNLISDPAHPTAPYTIFLVDTLVIDVNITIDGEITFPTTPVTYRCITIDAQNSCRALYIDTPMMTTATGNSGVAISDLIFINGVSSVNSIEPSAGDGGGIHITNRSYVDMTDIQVNNSSARYGGGIYNAGTLNIKCDAKISTVGYINFDLDISNNTASNSGGGIYNAGILTYKGSITANGIFGNIAETGHGGGIYNSGSISMDVAYLYFNSANSGNGGGIYSNTGDFIFTNSSLFQNYANINGGGICIVANYQQTAPISLYNIIASSNTAGQDGGVVYFTNGNSATNGTNVLNLEWCNFENNTAVHNGGAICLENNSGSITIATVIQTPGVIKSVGVQSEFLTNSAMRGGALYIENCNGNLTVDFVNISGNTAVSAGGEGGQGGAIYVANSSGNITLSDIEMSGNSASRLGGGIFYSSANSPAFNVTTSNISHNTASVSGGGIYLEKGNLNLVNCTLAYNGTDSSTRGGAIFLNAGTLEINFSTIAYNSGIGAAIYLDNSDAEITLKVNNSIVYNLDSEFSGITPTTESQIYIANPSNMSPSSVFDTANNIYSHYYIDLAVPGNHALNLGNVNNNRLIGYNSTAAPSHAGDKSKYIQSYLWLDQTLRYHANYRTMALAILNQNSWAFNAGDIQSDVTYDQRGNDRNGFYYTWVADPTAPNTGAWVKNTPAAGTKQSTIGAFEPLFHVEVTSKGDDTALNMTGDLNAKYFSNALGETGLTLREAVYWIDTRAALDPNNPTHYTYTNPFPAVPPNPANNFTVSDYNNRYIGFDTDPTHSVNFSSLNTSNIIELQYNYIYVGGYWGFYVNNDAAAYRDLAIAYLVRNTNNSGDIVYHDDTLRAHDDASRITVDAGTGGLFYITAPSVAAINNLTLINGVGASSTNKINNYGGGIYNLGGTSMTRTTLTNVVIQDCMSSSTSLSTPSYGGGIFNTGYMNIYDSSIIKNTASATYEARGGGIYNSGTIYVDRTQIGSSELTANPLINYGNVAKNTTVRPATDNGSMFVYGGGIYNSGNMIIERSEISGNSLNGASDVSHDIYIQGAGIYNSSSLRIANSTIAENTLAGVMGKTWESFGSGIYNKGTLYSYYNTISNNKTLTNNGGFWDAINLTTTSLDQLAGLYHYSGILYLANSIIAENVAILSSTVNLSQRADIYVGDSNIAFVDTTGANGKYNIIGAYNPVSGQVTWEYAETIWYYEQTGKAGNYIYKPVSVFIPAINPLLNKIVGFDWDFNSTNILGSLIPGASMLDPNAYISVPSFNPYNASNPIYDSDLATPLLMYRSSDGTISATKYYVNGLYLTASIFNPYSFSTVNSGGGLRFSPFSPFIYGGPTQNVNFSIEKPAEYDQLLNTWNYNNPSHGIVANLNLDFNSGLQYNGALTRTYRVLDGSVALDTGITVANPGGFLNFGTDQRGVNRDPLNHGIGTATNRGAFDYLDLITVRSAFDSSSPRTGFDFVNYRPLWDSSTLTLREAVLLADDGSGIDFKANWRINGTVDTSLPGGIVINELNANGNLIIALVSELQITRSTTVDFYPIPAVHVVIDHEINGSFTWIDGNGITHAGKTNWVDANGVTHAGGTNQLNAASGSRILNVASAVSNWLSTVTIANFTLSGGNVTGNGGGIFSASNLFLDNMTVQGCAAAGTYTASGVYSKDGLGGGIYSDAGYLELKNSRITGNTGVMGGGIYYASWNSVNTGLYISASSILNNTAKDKNLTRGDGGGIYLQSADAKIEYSAIGLNKAVSDGGGIFVATSNASTDLFLFNSTVANNTSGRNGAGISFYSNASLNLNFTTVANNQSGLTVTGAISGNAYAFGGGIYMNSGTLNIANSILAQNYRGSNSAISPVHDDIYLKNLNPNTIDHSIYGAVDGIKNDNGTPRYALTVTYSTNIVNWNTFQGKLDTQIVNNGGRTETVYVFDSTYFQKADASVANTLQVDQRMLEIFTPRRLTAGSFEKTAAAMEVYYISGEIGKGIDGGSIWISSTGVLLTEADGALNASNTTFILQNGLTKTETWHLDYSVALSQTLGYFVSTSPSVSHSTYGGNALAPVILSGYWDMKNPSYGSSLEMRVNANFKVLESATLGGKLSVTCASGDSNVLELITSNITTTYLSIHSTGVSNNTVIYSSPTPTQSVFMVDDKGVSNKYDYLYLYGTDRGINPVAALSTKNAVGTLYVFKDLVVGKLNGTNLRDNVKLIIDANPPADQGNLDFKGALIHNYGHIDVAGTIIGKASDPADFAIAGIANFSTLQVGYLTINNHTSISNMLSLTVDAGDLNMTSCTVTNVSEIYVTAATGNLLMAASSFIGATTFEVAGDMTLGTASSINKSPSLTVVDVTVGGNLTMTGNSLIQTVDTLMAGSMYMNRSTIKGNGTATIAVTLGDLLMTGATIEGVSIVGAAGNMNLAAYTSGITVRSVISSNTSLTVLVGADLNMNQSTIDGNTTAVTVSGDIMIAASTIKTATSISAGNLLNISNLTMTNSTITGSASLPLAIKTSGYLDMNNSTIDGKNTTINVGAYLKMLNASLIKTAIKIDAASIEIDASIITGADVVITVSIGDMAMTGGEITGVVKIDVAGDMSMQALGATPFTISKISGSATLALNVTAGTLDMKAGSKISSTLGITVDVTAGDLIMLASTIDGNTTAVTVSGDIMIAASTIKTATSISAGDLLNISNLTMTNSTITGSASLPLAIKTSGYLDMNNSTIDGKNTTINVGGYLKMLNASLIKTAIKIDAASIEMDASIITGADVVITVSIGDMAMTGSEITGVVKINVAGDMSMQALAAAPFTISKIIGSATLALNVTAGTLDMKAGSKISSTLGITVNVTAGDLIMLASTIDGNTTAVTVSGDIMIAASTIKTATSISAGDLLNISNLTMTNSTITGSTTLPLAIKTSGYLDMNNSTIDGKNTTINVGGYLKMLNASLIKTAIKIDVDDMTMETASSITGSSASISATGDILMTGNSTITGVKTVAVTGSLTMDNSKIYGTSIIVTVGNAGKVSNLTMSNGSLIETVASINVSGIMTLNDSSINGVSALGVPFTITVGTLILTGSEISVSSSLTLIVTGNLDMNDGTINGNTASVTVFGNLTMLNSSLIQTATKVDVSGIMTMGSGSTINGTVALDVNAGKLIMSGSSTINNALTVDVIAGSGLVNGNMEMDHSFIYGASISVTVGNAGKVSNLTMLNSSLIETAKSVTVSGIITLNESRINGISAPFTVTAGALVVISGKISTDSTLTLIVYGNVNMNNSTITGNTASVTVFGNLTMLNSSLIQTATKVDVSGIMTMGSDSTINGTAALDVNAGKLVMSGSSTINNALTVDVIAGSGLVNGNMEMDHSFIYGASISVTVGNAGKVSNLEMTYGSIIQSAIKIDVSGIMTMKNASEINGAGVLLTVSAGTLKMESLSEINNTASTLTVTVKGITGYLDMNNSTINGNTASVTVKGYLKMSGGTIKTATSVTAASFDMTDGSTIKGANAIITASSGNLKITDSTIDGTVASVEVTIANMEMARSTITGNGSATVDVKAGYLLMTGSTISGTVKVTVKGVLTMDAGTITDDTGSAVAVTGGNMAMNTAISTLDVSAGTLRMKAGSKISSTTTLNVIVNGSLPGTGYLLMDIATIEAATTTVSATGNLTMAAYSSINGAISISAVNIDMNSSTINGNNAEISATGYLLMANSRIDGSTQKISVMGNMTMTTDSEISSDSAFALKAGKLAITDSGIIGLSTITVKVSSDISMTNSRIESAATIISSNNSLTMGNNSSIKGAVYVFTSDISISGSTISGDNAEIVSIGDMMMSNSKIEGTDIIIDIVGDLGVTDNSTITGASSITVSGAMSVSGSTIYGGTGITIAAIAGNVNLVGNTNLANVTICAGNKGSITLGDSSGTLTNVTLNGGAIIGIFTSAEYNTVEFKDNSNLTVSGQNNQIISKILTVSSWKSGKIDVAADGDLNLNIGSQALVLTDSTTANPTSTSLNLGLDKLTVGLGGRFEVDTTNTVASNAPAANNKISGTFAVYGKISYGSQDFKINLTQLSSTLELGGTITIMKDATGTNATISMQNSLNIVGNVVFNSQVTGNMSITSSGGSIIIGSELTPYSKFTGKGKNLTLSAFSDVSVGNITSVNTVAVTSTSGDIHLLNSITANGNVIFTNTDIEKGVLVHKAFAKDANKLTDTPAPIVITAGTAGTINTTGAGYSAYLGDGSELQLSAGSTTLTSDLNTVDLNRSLTLIKGKYASDGITLSGVTASLVNKGTLTVNSITLNTGNLTNAGTLKDTGTLNSSITMAGGDFTNSGTVAMDNLTMDGGDIDNSNAKKATTFTSLTLGGDGIRTLKLSATKAISVTTFTLDTGNAYISQGKLTVNGNFNFGTTGSQYMQIGAKIGVLPTLEIKGAVMNDSLTSFFVTPASNKVWVQPGKTGEPVSFFLSDDPDNIVSQIDMSASTSTASKLVGLGTFNTVSRNGKYNGPFASHTDLVNRTWTITRTASDKAKLTSTFRWAETEQGETFKAVNANLYLNSGASTTWSQISGAGQTRNDFDYTNVNIIGSGSYVIGDTTIAANDNSFLRAQLDELKEKLIDAIFGAKEDIVEQHQIAEAQERAAMENMLSQMADRGNLMERNQLFKSEVDLGLEALMMA